MASGIYIIRLQFIFHDYAFKFEILIVFRLCKMRPGCDLIFRTIIYKIYQSSLNNRSSFCYCPQAYDAHNNCKQYLMYQTLLRGTNGSQAGVI